MRGFFEIGIYHTKTIANVGSLWRSANQLGASGIFTIGQRYKNQSSDTLKTPLYIPLREYLTFEEFMKNRPVGATLVGVEMGGVPLSKFEHPAQAIYLLGAEDHGLPRYILEKCNRVICLEAEKTDSYNVAIAGSIVMYHRVYLQNN